MNIAPLLLLVLARVHCICPSGREGIQGRRKRACKLKLRNSATCDAAGASRRREPGGMSCPPGDILICCSHWSRMNHRPPSIHCGCVYLRTDRTCKRIGRFREPVYRCGMSRTALVYLISAGIQEYAPDESMRRIWLLHAQQILSEVMIRCIFTQCSVLVQCSISSALCLDGAEESYGLLKKRKNEEC